MDIVENVVSGLLVALAVWGAQRAQIEWRKASYRSRWAA